MKFNEKELKLVERALTEREVQLTSFIREWSKAEWNNIGGMQNLYANENAFKSSKEQNLKEWKSEMEEIDKLKEKMEDMDN